MIGCVSLKILNLPRGRGYLQKGRHVIPKKGGVGVKEKVLAKGGANVWGRP